MNHKEISNIIKGLKEIKWPTRGEIQNRDFRGEWHFDSDDGKWGVMIELPEVGDGELEFPLYFSDDDGENGFDGTFTVPFMYYRDDDGSSLTVERCSDYPDNIGVSKELKPYREALMPIMEAVFDLLEYEITV